MIELTIDEWIDIKRMLEDAQCYIEQAQILVAESDRKGAVIVHGMGTRLLERMSERGGE